MHFNGRFDISVGQNRFSTSWKQETTEWEDFCERLRVPHRTAETYKEFTNAKKARQDEIKDIGGFVGGLIRGGNRLASAVVHRQLITLDIDFAPKGFWEGFKLMYDNAACIYSTHKHNSAAPRLRLLMPLDREVFPDEYQAICRRVAGNMGIDYFDHTTFQPERLMYWPSVAKDGEYEFDVQDGPWLSADEVLGSYSDWHDISQWPVSDRFTTSVVKGNPKLGNPLEKPGIIGAFCRTYSMTAGIKKFLSHVYEETDKDDRFTFSGGSTASGLVIYDDLFAFSHHGTDPASGRGVNIFDLCRIHLFPDIDKDVKEHTPLGKWPSSVAMMELAAGDTEVRGLMGRERLEGAADAFSDFVVGQGGDIVDGAADGGTEWLKLLEVDKKGNPLGTIANVVLVLDNDPFLKRKLRYNAFTYRQDVLGRLPWHKPGLDGGYWTDVDDANLRLYLEQWYKIQTVGKIEDGVSIVFDKYAFHPVRDYFEGLVWDGIERLDTCLRDYLGADDNIYVRAVARKGFVASVARVMVPGIKFDTAPILVGPQGCGKSTFIRLMGKDWYTDSFGSMDNNRAFEQIQGFLLVEMGELAGMKKTEANDAKHFMSKGSDTFRPAYAKRIATFKRQCVFYGTTNDVDFLTDPTGNRRYWPVNLFGGGAMYSVFEDLTPSVVDMIWAEAVHKYRQGESLILSPEEEALAYLAQKEHTEKYIYADAIKEYLEIRLPENWASMGLYQRREYIENYKDPSSVQERGEIVRQVVCVQELWTECLKGDMKTLTRYISRDMCNFMRGLEGWGRDMVHIRIPGIGMHKGFKRLG